MCGERARGLKRIVVMEFSRRWRVATWLAAALVAGVGAPLPAQRVTEVPDAGTGSLTGRITNLKSLPVAGVTVVLRNEATGAETKTTTARNGSYRFAALEAGAYTLAAESTELGRGELEGVVISAGHEARVQAAMDFERAGPDTAVVAENRRTTGTVEARIEEKVSAPLVPAAQPAGTAPVQLAAVARESIQEPREDVAEAAMPDARGESGGRSGPTLALTAGPASAAATKGLDSTAASGTAPIASANEAPVRTPNSSAPARAAIPAPATPAPAATAPIIAAASSPAAPVARAAAVAPDSVAMLTTSAPMTGSIQPLLSTRTLKVLPIMAAIAKVDPVIPVLATTVSASEVAALPASGRNWQNFALETPAAQVGGDQGAAAYRGEDQAPAEITIDGAPTRLAFGAAADTRPADADSGTHGQSGIGQGLAGETWNGGRGFNAGEAGVREVQTIAGNVEAEAARGTGGSIAVKTEQGENQLHGQLFGFDRQNTWGAKNPFTQWVENAGTSAAPVFSSEAFTPPDHEMAWGAGLGGRLRRNKLYWFGAVDSYRRNDPGLSTVKLPMGVDSYGRCAGFFCAPSVPAVELLSAQLNESYSQAENDYLGIANGSYTAAGLEQLDALLGPAPRTAKQWVGFGRVDWQVAERHHVTVEGAGADWNAPGGGLTRLSENYGSHSYGSNEANEEWVLARWEAYLTPNLLTTLQGSAGRDILRAKPDVPSPFEQTLLKANAWGQLPQIVADSRYGFTIGNPSRFGEGSYPDEKMMHVEEQVDWVHGRLLVKAGAEVDHNADSTSLLRNETGTYYYSKVQNFITDALAYEKFGLTNLSSYENPHTCNPSQNSLGALPCYSYYSQTIGPQHWRLSTTDIAGFATGQWQPAKQMVLSFGMRWERELLPPPIGTVDNPQLPLTERLPDLGNQWGPRLSFALGNSNSHWPVLRVGYGMYFGRTENATLETALSQTGSLKGDLSFFIRPTDGMNRLTYTSGAPMFPYVLQGPPASVVKPGAVGFAPNFKNPEVHQAVVSVEEVLPGHVQVTAAGMASLGRRLPISIDTNLNQPTAAQTITYAVVDATGNGPIKTPQISVPFYASWPGNESSCPYYTPASTLLPGRPCPDYQQISEIMSRANSTYEAAMIKVSRYGRRGLSLHAHYTYAHAMDWNPNETTVVAGSDVLDPADFSQEYGVSDLDVRHSAGVMAMYETPWRLKKLAGSLGNGWMLSGIGNYHSGLPYTMRTSGSLPELVNEQTGEVIEGLGPGMNGSGGDNRVYGVGRNTYRYPQTWKADMRLAKRFDFGHMREVELMAESFNLFNHQNVTEIETTGYYLEPGSETSLPTLNYLTGLKANTTAFGQPLSINGSDFLRERQIQFGLRLRFKREWTEDGGWW